MPGTHLLRLDTRVAAVRQLQDCFLQLPDAVSVAQHYWSPLGWWVQFC